MSKIFDTFLNWCFGVGAFLLGAMALFLTYDVIWRYAFALPNIWAMQMSEYIMVYSTFLASAWVLRNEGHVGIGFVADRLSPKAQRVLGLITSFIGICACAILVWQSSKELAYSFQRTITTQYYPWKILEWPTFAAVPFGSFLLSIQFVRRTYRYVVARRQQNTHQQGELTKAPASAPEPPSEKPAQ